MKYKQSETKVIKRSSISMNPINPKVHSDELVKIQKKNLQKVGYLGGVVWNRLSGNLIDGHRRIMAMDIINKYDGTPETDYEIKVEEVTMDDKTEKEQLTYMAVGSSKYDINLIADYINEIDYTDLGLNASELNEILSISNDQYSDIFGEIDDITEEIIPEAKNDINTPGANANMAATPNVAEPSPTMSQEEYEQRKQHMKDVKMAVKENAQKRLDDENAYLILSFSSYEAKVDMCDLLGINADDKYAKGEQVLSMIQ